MNTALYKSIRFVGYLIFGVAASPIVLHQDREPKTGGCILAANHTSSFDVPLLIIKTKRLIHWLSIVELFKSPGWRWFLNAYGALPLDRSKPDMVTTRRLVRLLKDGCMVGMFPEGQLRQETNSVLVGGDFDAGICGLAQLADVPVLPCVILGSGEFLRWTSWLPLRRTKFQVAYGKPVYLRKDVSKAEARAIMQRELQSAFMELRAELCAAISR